MLLRATLHTLNTRQLLKRKKNFLKQIQREYDYKNVIKLST